MIKFGQVQAYDKTTGEATIVYMRPDACAKCGALHLPHRMCPECGSYNGREVKVVKSVAAK